MASPIATPSIPVSVPQLSGNEWKYVKECLDSEWISSAGPHVTKFEDQFAKRMGVSHAVAVTSGTAALHMALLLAGVGPEEEVILPTITFIAPINAVRYVGAYPLFMDCDDFLNIDPEKTKAFCETECFFNGTDLINKKTKAKIKALLLVHVLGTPANIAPFMSLAERFHLQLIEDAAESLGSFYRTGAAEGKQTGTIGDFGCFSFNGNKLVTAGGGGMILARSGEALERARYYTTQAKDEAERFLHHHVGYNYRLNNLQAAVGCAQLEQLDYFLAVKRKNFSLYEEALAGIPGVQLLGEPEYGQSNYWLYTLRVDETKYGRSTQELKQALKNAGIETRWIWHPNHLQIPYRQCQTYRLEQSPDIQKKYLNLPSSVGLKPEEIQYIGRTLQRLAKDR